MPLGAGVYPAGSSGLEFETHPNHDDFCSSCFLASCFAFFPRLPPILPSVSPFSFPFCGNICHVILMQFLWAPRAPDSILDSQ